MKSAMSRRPVRLRLQLELLESRLQPGSLLSSLGSVLADTTLADLNDSRSDQVTAHRLIRQEPAGLESKPGQGSITPSTSPSAAGRGAVRIAPAPLAEHPAAPSPQSLADEMLALGVVGRHTSGSRTTTPPVAAAHLESISAGSAVPVLSVHASGIIAQPIPTQGKASQVVVLPNLIKTVPMQFATVRHWNAADRNGPPPPADAAWATYVTGTGTSAAGLAVATDQNQNAYVAGSEGEGDAKMAFVAEYASDGTPLYYAEFQAIDPDPGFTYGSTEAHAIAVDPNGNAYVTGVAVRQETGNTQAFGMKLDASGNIVPGYGGGLAVTPTSNSSGDGITVDADGQATLVGSAQVGQSQETVAVALKYNAQGGAIPIYAAGYRFSGFDASAAKAVVLDATADNAYIVGSILPSGATEDDILALKIDNTGPQAGQHPSYALTATNDGEDVLNGVAVDDAGNAYVMGTVTYQGQPTAYTAEIDAAGDAFVYASLFDSTLSGTGVSWDDTNNVSYVTATLLDPQDGLVHAAVAELDASGSLLDAYITAGDTMDTAQGVAFGGGTAYLVGTTSSTDLSTDGTTLNGKGDAFLTAASNFS